MWIAMADVFMHSVLVVNLLIVVDVLIAMNEYQLRIRKILFVD